jgi:putative methylase
MRRRELEMTLQSLEGFTAPRPELEQYSTPAVIAADLLFEALARGDVEGKNVLDLGCGTGVLGIGASLLGAKRVLGVDRDPQAIEQARANALRVGASVEFQEIDVDEMTERMDTVIMNPPFAMCPRHLFPASQPDRGLRPALHLPGRVSGQRAEKV